MNAGRRRKALGALASGIAVILAVSGGVFFALREQNDGAGVIAESDSRPSSAPSASAPAMGSPLADEVPLDISYKLVAVPEGFEVVAREQTPEPSIEGKRVTVRLENAQGEELTLSALRGTTVDQWIENLGATAGAVAREIITLHDNGSPMPRPATVLPPGVLDERGRIAWRAWEYGAFEITFSNALPTERTDELAAAIRAATPPDATVDQQPLGPIPRA